MIKTIKLDNGMEFTLRLIEDETASISLEVQGGIAKGKGLIELIFRKDLMRLRNEIDAFLKENPSEFE